MSPELTEYMPLIIGGIIGALVAIFVVMRLNRRARVIRDEGAPKDVLDEGAAPAARNQAFIDSAPSAERSASEPEQTPTATASTSAATADDLTRIKGLGPKIATMLGAETCRAR